jgi:predicted GTPase
MSSKCARTCAANPERPDHRRRFPPLRGRPGAIRGKRVLVIEDGPTLTHGEMAYGAGWVAARRFGAPKSSTRAPLRSARSETYQKYPKTGPILPAMGYGDEMTRDLEETIQAPMSTWSSSAPRST